MVGQSKTAGGGIFSRYWPQITQIEKYNSLIPENQIPVLTWPSLEERYEKSAKFKRIEGSGEVIRVAKRSKIPVLIPDSRELGRESGLLGTAHTAIEYKFSKINNLYRE
jgi:hypothetical protein